MSAWIVVPFGILSVGFTVYRPLYYHHNATFENLYSLIGIADSEEVYNPLNAKYGFQKDSMYYDRNSQAPETSVTCCPNCGSLTEGITIVPGRVG